MDNEKSTTCRGCGAPLLPENAWMCDGCPCNSERGINHGIVPVNVCTCDECDPAQTGSTRKSATAVDRFYQATGELMVKASDYDALAARYAELKEQLDAVDCSHDDEEAAHTETLRMLEISNTRTEALLEACRAALEVGEIRFGTCALARDVGDKIKAAIAKAEGRA